MEWMRFSRTPSLPFYKPFTETLKATLPHKWTGTKVLHGGKMLYMPIFTLSTTEQVMGDLTDTIAEFMFIKKAVSN